MLRYKSAMSTRKHTRLQTEERRAQLLEASLVLFTERSYDDVSIDDIAESAGVSKGLLYHYFGESGRCMWRAWTMPRASSWTQWSPIQAWRPC